MELNKWLLRAAVGATSILAPQWALASSGDSSRSYKGEKTLGLRVGYVGHNESTSVGLQFSYRFSRLFRLAPSIDYVVRHKDTDALAIALDAQFLIPFSADRMAVYPYVGPKFASWTRHPGNGSENYDVTTRRSRLGFDAGVGIEANITPTFRAGISAGYTVMKQSGGFDAVLTLSYRF